MPPLGTSANRIFTLPWCNGQHRSRCVSRNSTRILRVLQRCWPLWVQVGGLSRRSIMKLHEVIDVDGRVNGGVELEVVGGVWEWKNSALEERVPRRLENGPQHKKVILVRRWMITESRTMREWKWAEVHSFNASSWWIRFRMGLLLAIYHAYMGWPFSIYGYHNDTCLVSHWYLAPSPPPPAVYRGSHRFIELLDRGFNWCLTAAIGLPIWYLADIPLPFLLPRQHPGQSPLRRTSGLGMWWISSCSYGTTYFRPHWYPAPFPPPPAASRELTASSDSCPGILTDVRLELRDLGH